MSPFSSQSFVFLLAFITTAFAYSKSVTLTPTNTDEEGASVSILAYTTVNAASNAWEMTAPPDAQRDWAIEISLDATWGFHADLPSNILFRLHSDTPTNTNTDLDPVFSFSVNNAQFFNAMLPADDINAGGNSAYSNTIFPACDTNVPPTAPLSSEDLDAGLQELSAAFPGYTFEEAIMSGWFGEAWQPAENVIEFPLEFRIDNDPINSLVYVNHIQPTYAQRCGFGEAFATEQGLQIHFGLSDAGEHMSITSFEIEYSYDPTPAPTLDPSQSPTANPSVAPADLPSVSPTVLSTALPSRAPTLDPTASPTFDPTATPTVQNSEGTASTETLVAHQSTSSTSTSTSAVVSLSSIKTTAASDGNSPSSNSSGGKITLRTIIVFGVCVFVALGCVCLVWFVYFYARGKAEPVAPRRRPVPMAKKQGRQQANLRVVSVSAEQHQQRNAGNVIVPAVVTRGEQVDLGKGHRSQDDGGSSCVSAIADGQQGKHTRNYSSSSEDHQTEGPPQMAEDEFEVVDDNDRYDEERTQK